MNLQGVTAGVDEAGRGPLAGPVVAAAVVLNRDTSILGLDDSKKLSEKKRIMLEEAIKSRALCWSLAWASVTEIDEINILQATLLAMSRAVKGLRVKPDYVLVDGNQMPKIDCPGKAVVKGDSLYLEISAASILAKQARDREMLALSKIFPHYGFEKHKGYATLQHMDTLNKFGACALHRKSFAPVRRVLEI